MRIKCWLICFGYYIYDILNLNFKLIEIKILVYVKYSNLCFCQVVVKGDISGMELYKFMWILLFFVFIFFKISKNYVLIDD